MPRSRATDEELLAWTRTAAPRLLLVEDNAGLAQTLTAALEALGAVVVARTGDAAEALAAAETLRPDAAFVDVHLLDGATGCEVAETLARRHGIPVVFVTADPDRVPADFPHALGMLEKPLRADRITLAMTLVARALAG